MFQSQVEKTDDNYNSPSKFLTTLFSLITYLGGGPVSANLRARTSDERQHLCGMLISMLPFSVSVETPGQDTEDCI